MPRLACTAAITEVMCQAAMPPAMCAKALGPVAPGLPSAAARSVKAPRMKANSPARLTRVKTAASSASYPAPRAP